MKSPKWMVGVLVAMIALSSHALAEEKAASEADDQPKAEKKEQKPRRVRLISPFSKLQSLTADQEERLKEIHARFLEQIKALQQQEKAEMMAVLTEDQRAELQQMDEAAKASKKAQQGEKRQKEKSEAKDAQQ